MLGELYQPRGLALETAQAVLEVDNPYACNVALGCKNRCKYCYVPGLLRMSRDAPMRFPKKPPVQLVTHQLDFGKLKERPGGVFLCFLTDPFLSCNEPYTELLIEELTLEYEIPVATLSKVGTSLLINVRHGMSIVSLDKYFCREWEPNVASPKIRVACLRDRGFSWVSMEPYPPVAIWRQHLAPLLEEIKFVDLIIFGKWNYDRRANTEAARADYAQNILMLEDFCKSNSIRLHVKSNTLAFAFTGGQ